MFCFSKDINFFEIFLHFNDELNVFSYVRFRAEPEPAAADRYMDLAARAARDATAAARALVRQGKSMTRSLCMFYVYLIV